MTKWFVHYLQLLTLLKKFSIQSEHAFYHETCAESLSARLCKFFAVIDVYVLMIAIFMQLNV